METMHKLLYDEVEITPGKIGQQPQMSPVPEGLPLAGSVVVRLTNTTRVENAYTVRLRGEAGSLLEEWYTVRALVAAPGAQNAAPGGKRDTRGPQDRSVKLYVPPGGTRDVLIRFNAPRSPEARAGRYGFKIEVQTEALEQTATGRRQDYVTELPGRAIVRPFYQWSVDVTPEEKPVKRLRRNGEFDIVVMNEGNDWLYCDLQVPHPKNVLVDAPTVRVAVPPAEPGELLPAETGREARPGTMRTVPLRAGTQLKNLRGDSTRQPLPVSAVRVDAPSIPPPMDADNFAMVGTVVAHATAESQSVTGERALVYTPPVPAKFTDIFSKGGTSIKSAVMTVIGLIVAVNLMIIMYENMAHGAIRETRPQSYGMLADGRLKVHGKLLSEASIAIDNGTNKDDQVCKPLSRTDTDVCTIAIDMARFKNSFVTLTAHRLSFIPILGPLLPGSKSSDKIAIGNPIVGDPHKTVKVEVCTESQLRPGPNCPKKETVELDQDKANGLGVCTLAHKPVVDPEKGGTVLVNGVKHKIGDVVEKGGEKFTVGPGGKLTLLPPDVPPVLVTVCAKSGLHPNEYCPKTKKIKMLKAQADALGKCTIHKAPPIIAKPTGPLFDMKPDFEAMVHAVSTEANNEAAKKAVAAAEAALKQDKNDPDALILKGLGLLWQVETQPMTEALLAKQKARWDEANAALQMARFLKPNDPILLTALAKYQFTTYKTAGPNALLPAMKKAEDLLGDALKYGGGAYTHYLLGQVYEKLSKDADEQAREYASATTADPKYVRARKRLYFVYKASGNETEAGKVKQEAAANGVDIEAATN